MATTKPRKYASIFIALALVASMVIIPLASADNRNEERSTDGVTAPYDSQPIGGEFTAPDPVGETEGNGSSEDESPDAGGSSGEDTGPEPGQPIDPPLPSEEGEVDDQIELGALALPDEDEVEADDHDAAISPLATGVLEINTSTDPVSWVSLKTVLEGLFTPEEIAAATVIKFTGSTPKLQLGDHSDSPSITYLNTLGIDTIDLSEFTGKLGAVAFMNARNIHTVALGTNVTDLVYGAFDSCTSLTTVSDTLEHAGQNPGVIDLARTGVTSMGNGYAFNNCQAITTVTLGQNIEKLPSSTFGKCRSLTTLSDSIANASTNEGIIDLAQTGVKTLGMEAFGSCTSITAVTLGPSITQLPNGLFSGSSKLSAVSNSIANVRANPTTIDLEKTNVTSFDAGGQFRNNQAFTTVTLGKNIESLPGSVFSGCKELQTLSDTVANATLNPRVIDLDSTGVKELKSEGWQFSNCTKINAVALGTKITSLPSYVFNGCYVMSSLSDTIENTNGESRGFIDLAKFPGLVLEPGGHQFQGARSAVVYVGSDNMTFPVESLINDRVFVPETVRTVTLGAGTRADKFYVRGPEDSSPTAVVNPENQVLTRYYDVTVTTDGRGTVAPNKHLTPNAFLWNVIENREVSLGNLEAGHNYVEEGIDLHYSIDAAYGREVDEITYNGVPVEPISAYFSAYVLPAVTEDTVIHVTFTGIQQTVFEFFTDREGYPIPGLSNQSHTVDEGSSYTGTVPSAEGYVYQGSQTSAPYATNPSTVSDKVPPTIDSVDAQTHIYYIYDRINFDVIEHHVDRTGQAVAADTSKEVGYDDTYTGSNLQYPTGKVFVGTEYTAPSAENRSTVDDEEQPQITNVKANAEVWYVYGDDNGGGQTPGPGGGGTYPDGYEDFTIERQWVTKAVDGFSPLPSTTSDKQIVNVGDSFELAQNDVPAPSVPAGYEYIGYLTDQDALGATPRAGTPNIVSSVVDGNRTVYYVYAAELEAPGINAPLETATRITGSAALGNTVTVVFANGQSATAKANATAPIAPAALAESLAAQGQDLQTAKASEAISPRAEEVGYWSVEVPAGVTLVRGDVVTATQTDLLGRVGPVGTTTVLPVDHNVTVTYVDESGKALQGGSSISVAHRQPFTHTPVAITGYTYSGWTLNGADQGAGNPSIDSVTAAHAVALVYVASTTPDPGPGPNPNPGNYDFVKAPNVKSVAPGETVAYTFTGFGNTWGASLDRFTITDKPDTGLDFVSADLPAFTGAKGVSYDVAYYTNRTGRTVLHENVDATKPFSFSAPRLASGEHITRVAIEFGTVPAGFAEGDTLTMQFRVWDNPPSKTLNNVGMLSYWKDGEGFEFSTGRSGSVVLGGYFSDLVRTGDGPMIALALFGAGIVAVLIVAATSFSIHKRRRMRRLG